VQRGIEACSYNHCSSGKAMSITLVCVCVCLWVGVCGWLGGGVGVVVCGCGRVGGGARACVRVHSCVFVRVCVCARACVCVFVALGTQHSICDWPDPLYSIFPYYLIKGTIFEKCY